MTSLIKSEWLEKLKEVRQSEKDVVFGYINRLQRELFPESSDYYRLPSMIKHLALLYVHVFDIKLSTPNHYEYKHWFDVDLTRKCIRLQVKASNDAHVALGCDKSHHGQHWEIVLCGWGNTQSVIRKRNQGPHQAVHRKKLLDRNGFTAFWIRWDEQGELCVGRGDDEEADETVMMACPFDKAIPIRLMSVSTGWGSTGEWILRSDIAVIPRQNIVHSEGMKENEKKKCLCL